MHVVVIQSNLKIGNLSMLDGNFGKNLTYPQLEPTKATYEQVSGTYKPVGGHVDV